MRCHAYVSAWLVYESNKDNEIIFCAVQSHQMYLIWADLFFKSWSQMYQSKKSCDFCVCLPSHHKQTAAQTTQKLCETLLFK